MQYQWSSPFQTKAHLTDLPRRSSIRRVKRPRTVSVGSLGSREGTPDTSLQEPPDPRVRKKLSFEGEEEGEVGALPGDLLPGEIFALQDIVEEPAGCGERRRSPGVRRLARYNTPLSSSPALLLSSTLALPSPLPPTSPLLSLLFSSPLPHLPSTSSSGFSSQGSVMPAAPRLSPIPSADHTISLAIDIGREEEAGGEGKGSLGDSVPPPSLSDIPSLECGAAREGALLGVIRQGTSVSSVSSVGSYTFQEPPSYASGRHSRRRPQLSESEDCEPVAGRQAGEAGRPVARQDTFTRNTFPARGKQRAGRPAADGAARSVSVPPKAQPPQFASLPDAAREPAYWGLAHPLAQAVLYPALAPPAEPPPATELARLPVVLGSLLAPSPTLHSPSTCLACYRLQLSARPRASSLTAAAQGREGRVPASSSLPPSHQSPALARRSWVGGDISSPSLPHHSPSSSPTGWREARSEAMDLVCLMNNSVKAKQAEVRPQPLPPTQPTPPLPPI